MAAEMPARVEAVEGAVVVDFPWSAATSAVAALNAASSKLGDQFDARSGMLDTLDDWEGTYREEFDSTYGRLWQVGTGLKGTLTSLASSIVTGAEDANQEQRDNNARALDPDAQPVTTSPGGRNIPI